MAKVRSFRFKVRQSAFRPSLPSRPSLSPPEIERLTGQVRGMEASEPEERLARALDRARIPYLFRYVVGAPKGLPGWKEVDFLAVRSGIVYPIEVDTAFTHRGKKNKDFLHDAIILNDREIQTLGTVWPAVIHAYGETDLADDRSADNFVKRL